MCDPRNRLLTGRLTGRNLMKTWEPNWPNRFSSCKGLEKNREGGLPPPLRGGYRKMPVRPVSAVRLFASKGIAANRERLGKRLGPPSAGRARSSQLRISPLGISSPERKALSAWSLAVNGRGRALPRALRGPAER